MPSALSRLFSTASLFLLSACASTPYQPTVLNGNIALPTPLLKDARQVMVRQRLLDVGGSGGAATVLSEQFLNNPKHNPVVYALPYDRHAIHPGGHYELDTQVYANGELKWHTTQPLSDSGQGLPATVDINPSPSKP